MTTALRKIYQLKVSLKGAKPPIWRRFLIDSAVTLPLFHDALQIIMGWTDSHLHQFIVGNRCYGVPDPEWDFVEINDEEKVKLNQLLRKEEDSIIYEYDFGDGWEHKITLEKVLPFDHDAVLPLCIKARGACPPEDIGGIWGYYNFLDALNNSNHPEHEEFREWVGVEFDSAAYDMDEVNQLLSEYCR